MGDAVRRMGAKTQFKSHARAHEIYEQRKSYTTKITEKYYTDRKINPFWEFEIRIDCIQHIERKTPIEVSQELCSNHLRLTCNSFCKELPTQCTPHSHTQTRTHTHTLSHKYTFQVVTNF